MRVVAGAESIILLNAVQTVAVRVGRNEQRDGFSQVGCVRRVGSGTADAASGLQDQHAR